MPKKAKSSREKQINAFMRALGGGQKLMKENDADLAKLLQCSKATICRKMKDPLSFSWMDISIMANHYGWTDYQIAQITGVEYCGSTPSR